MSESGSLQRAEVQGRQAASKGLAHSENPYAFAEQSKLHLRWSHAWLVERVEIEDGIKIYSQEELSK